MDDDPLYRDLPDSFDERCPAPAAAPKHDPWPFRFSVFVCLSVTGAILTCVVPRFAEIFRAVHLPLPTQTSLLLAVSDFACSYACAWLPAAIFISWLAGRIRMRPIHEICLILGFAVTLGFIVWALMSPLFHVIHCGGSR